MKKSVTITDQPEDNTTGGGSSSTVNIKNVSGSTPPTLGILKKSRSVNIINEDEDLVGGMGSTSPHPMMMGFNPVNVVVNRGSRSSSPIQRLNKTPSNSTEDLYLKPGYSQYHSPTYSRPINDVINEESDGIMQQPAIMINNVLSSSGGISPPSHHNNANHARRTHKRANSHGPPSRPTNTIIYSPPHPSMLMMQQQQQQQQQPQIITPHPQGGGGGGVSSPPNVQRTTTTSTFVIPTMSNTGNNRHSTWSPSRIKKSKHIIDSMLQHGDQLAGLLSPLHTNPSTLQQQQQQQQQQDHKNQKKKLNHRRTVSLETPESLEALNQIIKEKKDALVMRERELIAQQKLLDKHIRNSQHSSPPNTGGITSSSSSSSISSSFSPIQNQEDQELITIEQNPSVQQIQQLNSIKHSRSKSDTNTFVKLHLIKKQQQQQQQQQMYNNNVNNNNNSPPQISNQEDLMYSQYHSPNFKSPKVMSPGNEGSRSPRPHSSPRPIPPIYDYSDYMDAKSPSGSYKQQSPLYTTTTTTTTSTTSSPIPSVINTSPNTAYTRRKSVDPMIYVGGLKPINPQSLDGGGRKSTSSYYYNNTGQNSVGRLPSSSNNNYNVYIERKNQPYYSNSNYHLNTVQPLDLQELEDEIDKEIQQVILQTKSIQGKVDLLERVRCTAPDPLCMLFGDGYRYEQQQKQKTQKQTGYNVHYPSTSPSSSTIINSQSNQINYNNNHKKPPTFTTLLNHNVISNPINSHSHIGSGGGGGISNSSTSGVGANSLQSISSYANVNPQESLQGSHAPDRSKSKNLASSLRSSAFSPTFRS